MEGFTDLVVFHWVDVESGKAASSIKLLCLDPMLAS